MQDFQEGSRRKGIVSKINLDIKRGEDRGVYYRRQLISLESDPTPHNFNSSSHHHHHHHPHHHHHHHLPSSDVMCFFFYH